MVQLKLGTWVVKRSMAKLVRYIFHSVLEVWYDTTFHGDGLRLTKQIYIAPAFNGNGSLITIHIRIKCMD